MKRFPLPPLQPAIAVCTLAVLGVGQAHGQSPVVLYTFDGSQPGERLGWSLVGPGDLNGDSVPDVLAGGPGDFISGGFPGIVRAYSGLDGSVIYTVSGQQNADGFGMAIAALPDIDGDGRVDFVVGAPYDDSNGVDSGSAYVFSGATGALIHKINGAAAGDAFGWSLCNGRDFNEDGLPDLAVGAPLADSPLPDSGAVSLFDPVTGTQLNAWGGASALAEFGYCVASSAHGAGTLEKFLFAGAPGMHTGGGFGAVLIWIPGQTPAPFFLPSVAVTTGLTLSGFSVANGPGTLTCGFVAIGAFGNGQSSAIVYSNPYNGGGFQQGGGVFGSPQMSITMSTFSDGSPDAAILFADSGSLGWQGAWQEYAWTGAQQSAGSLNWQASGLTRAWALASLRNVNADSSKDFAVGDPTVTVAGQDAGRVVFFLSTTPYQPPAIYCSAKANSQGCTPRVGFVGAPSLSIGDNFSVTATSVLNNKPGLMLWSLNQNNIPFGGGTLCVGPLFHRTGIQFTGGNPPPSDCSGGYSFHFSQAYMSAQALTPGITVYCQYYSRDDGFPQPQNIGLTDAVRFTVLP